ncbi:MAG: cytochrome c [Jannaschia sp.]
MTRPKIAVLVTLATVTVSTIAYAQTLPPAVKARQGQMQIQAFATSVLGGMAKGETEYDAAMAEAAATDLVATGMMSIDLHWPEGTSSEDVEGTRALPAIWTDRAGFEAKWEAFDAAAAGMQDAAGGGLEGLQAAMGTLGQSCGGCHDDYRQPR